MSVEVLYFDGCPSHEALLPRLRELMTQAGVDEPVQLTHVESVEAAQRERFLGSPSLRIDGEDVDPTTPDRSDFGLKCRLYAGPEGLRGRIPDELIRVALTRSQESQDGAQPTSAARPADSDGSPRA